MSFHSSPQACTQHGHQPSAAACFNPTTSSSLDMAARKNPFNTHPLKSSFTRLQQLHSFKLTRQQLLYPVSYLLKPGLRSVCVSVLFLVVSGAWFLNLCLVCGGGGGCFLSSAPRLRARVSFLILRNGRSRVSFLIIIFLNRWGGCRRAQAIIA